MTEKEKYPLKGLDEDQINDYFQNQNWHESRDNWFEAFNHYLSNKKAKIRAPIIPKRKYDEVLQHELLVKTQEWKKNSVMKLQDHNIIEAIKLDQMMIKHGLYKEICYDSFEISHITWPISYGPYVIWAI